MDILMQILNTWPGRFFLAVFTGSSVAGFDMNKLTLPPFLTIVGIVLFLAIFISKFLKLNFTRDNPVFLWVIILFNVVMIAFQAYLLN